MITGLMNIRNDYGMENEMKSIEETSAKRIKLSFKEIKLHFGNKIQTISKANLILRFGHTQNQNQNQFAPIVAN